MQFSNAPFPHPPFKQNKVQIKNHPRKTIIIKKGGIYGTQCVLVRLLFGHQAVNPCRVNTACAPIAAYTWTPSRNPPARIPPCPSGLIKAPLLGTRRRARHCFRSLGPHRGRVGRDEYPLPGISPLCGRGCQPSKTLMNIWIFRPVLVNRALRY